MKRLPIPTIFLLVMVVTTTFGQGNKVSAKSFAKTVTLKTEFCCTKTTEAGEDEFFVVVAAKTSAGKILGQRVPEDHWDMNDGDQPWNNPDGASHCLTNRELFSTTLESGQSVAVVVSFMEKDGGNTKDAQSFASGLLKQSGDPIAIGAGTALNVYTAIFGAVIEDSDDFIGSYLVTISNTKGTISYKWRGLERIWNADWDEGGPHRHHFSFNGDGSKYDSINYVEVK